MIIGLTGKNASGKGEAAEYLKSKGFEYYSLSDILREEAAHRKIEPSRENLIKLGNELRKIKGASVLAELTIKKIKNKKDYVVDSIRNPSEIEALRKLKKFILIGIDAPVEMRFKRAIDRKRPGDPETIKDFMEKEKKENTKNSTNQQLENCLKLVDFLIENTSNLEDFHGKINETIAKIYKA